MEKRFLITLNIIALVFITNISLASLSVYVTTVGTTSVSAPEFYIGSATKSEETLLVNEESPNCAHFDIKDDFTRAFITEEDFGGVDFNYIPKVEFSIRGHVSGTSTPQDLTLKFGYIDMNDVATNVCSTDVTLVSKMDNYTTELIDCSVERWMPDSWAACTACTNCWHRGKSARTRI